MRAGQRALMLNTPASYLDKQVPLLDGVEIAEEDVGPFDFVQLFVHDLAQLHALLPLAMQSMKPDALLWIAYPKGSAKTGTGLNRDRLWVAVSEHHLTGVSLVSLDEVWSAMRFRPSEHVASTRGRTP